MNIIKNFFTINFDAQVSNIMSFFKKLPKYILISGIIRLIVFIVACLFLDINYNILKLFFLILLFTNLFLSKNKVEYILTILFLMGFWFIIFDNIIVYYIFKYINCINEQISSYTPFIVFASSYDDLISLDLFNKDYNSNSLDSIDLKRKYFHMDDFYMLLKLGAKNTFFLYNINMIVDPTVDSVNLEVREDETMNLNNVSKNREKVRLEIANWMKEDDKLFNNIISAVKQLKDIEFNLEKYEAEKIKFNNIISNINNGTELWYPPESVNLFTEYLELLNNLISDLKDREFNTIVNIPLPKETLEEKIFFSEGKELEAEDYMDNAVHNMKMFEEEKELEAEEKKELETEKKKELEAEEKKELEAEDYMDNAVHDMKMFEEDE